MRPRERMDTKEPYMRQDAFQNGNFVQFPPITAYQSLLFAGDKSFFEYGSQIQSFPPMPTASRLYTTFEKAPNAFKAGQELYRMATSNQLTLKLKSGDLSVFSPSQYVSKSVSRLDPTHFDGPEFLMTSVTPMGLGIDQELKRRNMQELKINPDGAF